MPEEKSSSTTESSQLTEKLEGTQSTRSPSLPSSLQECRQLPNESTWPPSPLIPAAVQWSPRLPSRFICCQNSQELIENWYMLDYSYYRERIQININQRKKYHRAGIPGSQYEASVVLSLELEQCYFVTTSVWLYVWSIANQGSPTQA